MDCWVREFTSRNKVPDFYKELVQSKKFNKPLNINYLIIVMNHRNWMVINHTNNNKFTEKCNYYKHQKMHPYYKRQKLTF